MKGVFTELGYPTPYPAEGPFRHGVKWGDLIFISGLTAVDERGVVSNPGDKLEQTSVVMQHMEHCLAAFGASFDDIVKLTTNYVGVVGWKPAAKLLGQYFKEGPVWTAVVVRDLLEPGLVVMVDAIAIKGARTYAEPSFPFPYPTKLPFRHGVRCKNFIFVSGQTAVNEKGLVLYPDDMVEQTSVAIENMARTLDHFGASLDDVVKTLTWYKGVEAPGWTPGTGAIAAAQRRGEFFKEGPVSTGVPVPDMTQPSVAVQIDGVAVLDEPKTYCAPSFPFPYPAEVPFRHGVKVGELIFTSGATAISPEGELLHPGDMIEQTRASMENMRRVLDYFGATMDDVVKTNVWYVGLPLAKSAMQVRGEYFTQGPVSTDVVLDSLVLPELPFRIEMEAIAAVG